MTSLNIISDNYTAETKATISSVNNSEVKQELPINKLALLSRIQEVNEVNYQKLQSFSNKSTVERSVDLIESPSSEKPKVPSSNVPSWTQVRKSMIQAQLQELLDELQAMQEAGGDYPIAYIIQVSMAIISTLSTELQELVAKPLEHYQEISKRQAIVQEKIEAMKKKALTDPNSITEEDVEGLREALKDLDKAVEDLKAEYTFEDDDGNTITVWPNDEIKDIYEKAKKNTDMMFDEKIPRIDKSLRDGFDTPEEMKHAVEMFKVWAHSANSSKPSGAFVEWDNGKDGAQGNSVMKIILDTEISTYTDKLNKDAQLIASAQSMGQKQIESADALMRGIVGKFLSR